MDDDELASHIGLDRHYVNQVCRQLEGAGQIIRRPGRHGKLTNAVPSVAAQQSASLPSDGPTTNSFLAEDEVKKAVSAYLQAHGYTVNVMWGHDAGIDIDAYGSSGHLIIEAKGEVASPQQQGNYFLGALGELVQHMSDPGARYGLALPDNPRYRGLARRLPTVAKERLDIPRR
jgi:hypothetical protein